MKTLAELRKMLGDTVDQMEKMNALVVSEKGEIRSFTKDEQAQYDKLSAERATLKSAIDRAVETEEARSESERATKQVPAVSVTRAENHNDKGEYRGFKSLGEQLRCIVEADRPGGKTDKRLGELRAISGISTQVDADAGHLIQSDFMVDLAQGAYETGQLASECRQLTSSSNSNSVEIITVDESSRASGSRSGGVNTYWRAEAANVTASKPKLKQTRIALEGLMSYCYATEESLQDASLLEGLISASFIDDMAWVLDDAILNGDGVGKPLGILNSTGAYTQPKEGSQSADTVLFENVSNIYNLATLPSSRLKGSWFVNQEVLPHLEKMYVPLGSANGLPVYTPAGQQGPERLYNRPIKVIEQAKKLGDLGDLSFLDLTHYALLKKGGIDAQQSIHVRFEYAETAFRFLMRVGGQPLWSKAVSPANATGSRKVSPFVLLQAR